MLYGIRKKRRPVMCWMATGSRIKISRANIGDSQDQTFFVFCAIFLEFLTPFSFKGGSHLTAIEPNAPTHGLRTPNEGIKKISEKLGRCGRQNMLPPYLKIWEWEWIFGRATMWDVCTIDWPKDDAANFESQNFEGP